jgi:hypothetical protein
VVSLRSEPSIAQHPSFCGPIIDLTAILGLGDPKSFVLFQRTKGRDHKVIIDLTMDSDEEEGTQNTNGKEREGPIFPTETMEIHDGGIGGWPRSNLPQIRHFAQRATGYGLDLRVNSANHHRMHLSIGFKPILGACIEKIQSGMLSSQLQEFQSATDLSLSLYWPKETATKGEENTLPNLTVDPIYICPDDIVYLPEIYNIDIDSFLKEEKTHVIENVAIHASSALRLKSAEQVWGLPTSEGKLIGGPQISSASILSMAST